MRTIDELVNHINHFKDAVIFCGSGVCNITKTYDSKDFNENYSRKALKRYPEKLWDFYKNNLLTEIDNNNMYEMINDIPHSLIVNQNINGPRMNNVYDIHGNVGIYKCLKCKTIYPAPAIENEDGTFVKKCENCGREIRPSVLLSGERYDNDKFINIREEIVKTHTLIVIGLDYNEQALLDIIADYGDIKSTYNADGNPEEERMLVIMQDEHVEFDPAQITFPEFLVKGPIEEKLKIFYDRLKRND